MNKSLFSTAQCIYKLCMMSPYFRWS